MNSALAYWLNWTEHVYGLISSVLAYWLNWTEHVYGLMSSALAYWLNWNEHVYDLMSSALAYWLNWTGLNMFMIWAISRMGRTGLNLFWRSELCLMWTELDCICFYLLSSVLSCRLNRTETVYSLLFVWWWGQSREKPLRRSTQSQQSHNSYMLNTCHCVIFVALILRSAVKAKGNHSIIVAKLGDHVL
jgi:hypothetical protein